MTSYHVTWEIDVESSDLEADTPWHAANYVNRMLNEHTDVQWSYDVSLTNDPGLASWHINLLDEECPAGGPHTPTNDSSHPDRMTDPYWHCDECGASLPTPEREY